MSERKTNRPRLDDADWAYIMSDDSMIGARILPGDLVCVKHQCTAEDGDVVLVSFKGEKRIGIYSRHKDCEALTPANGRYQTILSSFDSPSFRVVGKAIAFVSELSRREEEEDFEV